MLSRMSVCLRPLVLAIALSWLSGATAFEPIQYEIQYESGASGLNWLTSASFTYEFLAAHDSS